MEYAVDWFESLEGVRVKVCFPTNVPSTLVAGTKSGRRLLTEPRLERPGKEPFAVTLEEGVIDLQAARTGDCLSYHVDLATVVRAFGPARLVHTGDWLWRPPRKQWRRFGDLRIRVRVPANAAFAAPWSEVSPGVYRSDARTFAFISRTVVGRFERQSFCVAQSCFRVALLPGVSEETAGLVRPWLEHAAQAVAAVGGRFPVRSVQITVLPGDPGHDAINFGLVTRGGGAAVTFLVGGRATVASLKRDWTTVHEFSHLWLPFVERRDAWLPEGIATYYQEVLRARSGVLTAQRAWARMFSACREGQAAEASLAVESARMYRESNFRRVYWGGAAFALLADIELRRRTGGEQSLDQALAALRGRWSAPTQAMTAKEVIAGLDQATGTTVFSELAARVVHRLPYPSLDSTYARLGLRSDGHRLEPESGDLGWIRDAIMSRTSRR